MAWPALRASRFTVQRLCLHLSLGLPAISTPALPSPVPLVPVLVTATLLVLVGGRGSAVRGLRVLGVLVRSDQRRLPTPPPPVVLGAVPRVDPAVRRTVQGRVGEVVVSVLARRDEPLVGALVLLVLVLPARGWMTAEAGGGGRGGRRRRAVLVAACRLLPFIGIYFRFGLAPLPPPFL